NIRHFSLFPSYLYILQSFFQCQPIQSHRHHNKNDAASNRLYHISPDCCQRCCPVADQNCLCQIISRNRNQSSRKATCNVVWIQQMILLAGKPNCRQRLDNHGWNRPDSSSRHHICQTSANRGGGTGIGHRQETACQIDKSISKMQISAVGSHWNVEEI